MTREEAIEWLDGELDYYEACVRCHEEDGAGVEAYKMAIEALKEPEIIRCKDCKDCEEVGPGLFYCESDYIIPIGNYVEPDGFCNFAKRRE